MARSTSTKSPSPMASKIPTYSRSRASSVGDLGAIAEAALQGVEARALEERHQGGHLGRRHPAASSLARVFSTGFALHLVHCGEGGAAFPVR